LRWIFREENFSRPFAAGAPASGQEAVFLTMQKRSIAHRASLAHFLLFCNQLPSTEIVDTSSSPDKRRGWLATLPPLI
jgi:hypothetical protein